MKLNWFSPLLTSETDIAHYTARTLAALQDHADVTLWSHEAHWDDNLARLAEIKMYRLDQVPWAQLNRADLNIYHVGNNPRCHGPIWQVSRRQPGIVVLHDVRLQDLFFGLHHQEEDRGGYLAHLARYYGEPGWRAGEKLWDELLPITHVAERFPLTPLAIEGALGVIVHSPEAFRAVRQLGHWPVVRLPLPYPASPRRTPTERRAGPPYCLVVFGYIGRNRRLDELFQALARLAEKQQFRLEVYGQVWEQDRVLARVKELGLQELVVIHGFVPEAELDVALERAHLAVNLRNPTMGEASGSQLRIWDHALPSLVSPLGWYGSLPETAVAFVRPDYEVSDLQAHLRAFLADPGAFAHRGAEGRRLLESNHAPAAYARSLVRFVDEVLASARPRALARHLTGRVGAELGAWLPAKGLDAVYGRLATEVQRLAS